MNPVKGWGSIATENGYVIIEPLSARPRYRVVYPEGVIVRSAADIDDSDFVRVIAKGEVVEGTGQVQMFDNVERVQVCILGVALLRLGLVLSRGVLPRCLFCMPCLPKTRTSGGHENIPGKFPSFTALTSTAPSPSSLLTVFVCSRPAPLSLLLLCSWHLFDFFLRCLLLLLLLSLLRYVLLLSGRRRLD